LGIVAPGDEDQPATKRELREVETRLLEAIGQQGTHLREAMTQQEKRITVTVASEMARQANIIIEQIGTKIAVVDEKYQDLPGRVATVEQRLDDHASDFTLHDRPPVPRRARAPKPKRKR
jgi:hypothetical protein